MQCFKLDEKARVPCRSRLSDMGFDVFACLEETVVLSPFERQAIPTGLQMSCPPHMGLRICPRSGLSLQGLDTMAGCIDSNYRGEVKVVLINMDPFNEIEIEPGMKIAQIVPLLLGGCDQLSFEEHDEPLDQTDRGCLGFGSSGNQ